MDPFFSFVVPTYNRAHIIHKTIDSALNQTHADFEMVIVDDGSTDNTEEAISKISDSRLVYFKKINEERGAARNYGVLHARGKYIVFLDSDDIVHPEFLEKVKLELEKNDHPELLHPRFNVIDENEEVLEVRPPLNKLSPSKLFTRNYFACNLVVRKDIALQTPFIEDRNFVVGEDWYVWLRLLSKYPFNFLNEILISQVREKEAHYEIPIDKLIYSRNAIIKHLKKDEVFMQKNANKLGSIGATMDLLTSIQYSIQGEPWKAPKYILKYLWLNPRLAFHKLHYMAIKSFIGGVVKNSKQN